MISALIIALDKLTNKINTWGRTVIQALQTNRNRLLLRVTKEWQFILVEIWFTIGCNFIFTFWYVFLKIVMFLERVLLKLLPLEVYITISYRLFKQKYVFPIKKYFNIEDFIEDFIWNDPLNYFIFCYIIPFLTGVAATLYVLAYYKTMS
jgi:hypothetical protein